MQSQNQILRAAASGDVATLRRLARETDPVLIAAVENRVCWHDSCASYDHCKRIMCFMYMYTSIMMSSMHSMAGQ